MTVIEIIVLIFVIFSFSCLIGILLFLMIDSYRPFSWEIARENKTGD